MSQACLKFEKRAQPRFQRASVLTLLLFCLLSACSTLHKTAEEFMSKESYDEAIQTYETILRRDPNDTDAITGLRTAKERFLDKRLIEIRLARIANNHEQSWDMLLDVVKRERSWNFYPTGKVTFSQEEETRLALDQLKLYIDHAVKEKFPLKAEHALKKYALVFEKTFNDEFILLGRRVAQSGKEKCAEYKKELSRKIAYFSQFTVRFCEYFSQPKDKALTENYYDLNDFIDEAESEIKLTKNQATLPSTWNALFESAIQEAISSTAWKHPHGKLKPKLQVSVALKEEIQKNKATLVHEYQVQVPYEKVEPVKARRLITQKGNLQVKDPYTGVMTSVPVNESKEYDEVIESRRTEFRTEARTFQYDGFKVSQSLRFEASVEAMLMGDKLVAPWIGSVQNESTYHDQNLPLVKLEPKPLKLPNADVWFQGEIQKLKQAWFHALKNAWIKKFCPDGDSKRTHFERGNDALRCARQLNDAYPAHVESWYEDHFGVSVAEFVDLFPRID